MGWSKEWHKVTPDATDLMKEAYWGRRMQRLSMNEGGREREWGERHWLFIRGYSVCTKEDTQLVVTVEMCLILVADDDVSCCH